MEVTKELWETIHKIEDAIKDYNMNCKMYPDQVVGISEYLIAQLAHACYDYYKGGIHE